MMKNFRSAFTDGIRLSANITKGTKFLPSYVNKNILRITLMRQILSE